VSLCCDDIQPERGRLKRLVCRYTFGLCSLWHLAAVSIVKCTVIIRPLTHFTIFTDRVLRAMICSIWILSLTMCSVINLGGIDVHFSWITVVAYVDSQVFAYGFGGTTFAIATLIIMIAYTKVFLVVRRQVRSMPTDVLGSYGSRTIFGSSVRSAKNLFVMCSVYYLTYVPVNIGQVLRARGMALPEAVQFIITWIYIASAALDGFLYISLHSSVRRELRRYLPRCRHRSVAPALTQPVGDGGAQRHLGDTVTATGVPVTTMTSSSRRVTQRLQTAVL